MINNEISNKSINLEERARQRELERFKEIIRKLSSGQIKQVDIYVNQIIKEDE